jgi:hypothetical protein
MKSIINTPETRAKIMAAIEKTLADCAYQHIACVEANTPFPTSQPIECRLSIAFVFGDDDDNLEPVQVKLSVPNGKDRLIIAQPIVLLDQVE